MTEPKTYRKKPVEVQAIQLNLLNVEHVEEFVGGDFGRDAEGNYVIATLEGPMKVQFSDYIIRGIQGEHYPCKPDIFAATYYEVSSNQYRQSSHTPVMTVAAVIEWLDGEKEDLQADLNKVPTGFGEEFAMQIRQKIGASITTVETLVDKLTESTFEQMDEATLDD